MPGHYDHFDVNVDCPVCGCGLTERYGRLRLDPRLTCRCGVGFAVYLSGCPIEDADLLWDARDATANDNDAGPFIDGSWEPWSAPKSGG